MVGYKDQRMQTMIMRKRLMTLVKLMLMRMMMVARSHLGLRGAGLKKRVGTADVAVMEINLTAAKNYDDHDHHHQKDLEIPTMMTMRMRTTHCGRQSMQRLDRG